MHVCKWCIGVNKSLNLIFSIFLIIWIIFFYSIQILALMQNVICRVTTSCQVFLGGPRVCGCVTVCITPDELVDTLYGSFCRQCVDGWMCKVLWSITVVTRLEMCSKSPSPSALLFLWSHFSVVSNVLLSLSFWIIVNWITFETSSWALENGEGHFY